MRFYGWVSYDPEPEVHKRCHGDNPEEYDQHINSDWLKHQNRQVWTVMLLMIISAVSAGITDLSFNARGYAWQTLNCILTASYSLTLRCVMDKAKQLTKSGTLNETSMVLLNNLLSLPFGMILILMLSEWDYVLHTCKMFWIVATACGLLGLAISFTSIWSYHIQVIRLVTRWVRFHHLDRAWKMSLGELACTYVVIIQIPLFRGHLPHFNAASLTFKACSLLQSTIILCYAIVFDRT